MAKHEYDMISAPLCLPTISIAPSRECYFCHNLQDLEKKLYLIFFSPSRLYLKCKDRKKLWYLQMMNTVLWISVLHHFAFILSHNVFFMSLCNGYVLTNSANVSLVFIILVVPIPRIVHLSIPTNLKFWCESQGISSDVPGSALLLGAVADM